MRLPNVATPPHRRIEPAGMRRYLTGDSCCAGRLMPGALGDSGTPARGLKDDLGADAELGEHVDQGVDAEEVDSTAHEVADARLGHAQELGSLALLQPARRNRLLEAQHQFGADLEVQSLIRRETEVAEHVTSRPGSASLSSWITYPFRRPRCWSSRPKRCLARSRSFCGVRRARVSN